MSDDHPMRRIRLAKVTLNIGAGRDAQKLERGMILLERITQRKPVQTITQKRIPNWELRPGLPIGVKVTVRGKPAEDLLRRLLTAKDFILSEKQFDNEGNVSFGIPEYIDVDGLKYDPKLGIMGFEVAVTLERPGFRVKHRRLQKQRIPRHHRITREEAITFMKDVFGVKIKEEIEG